MRRTILSTVAAATLILSACGGDSSSGEDQARVADLVNDLGSEQGLELDKDCIDTATAKLSDADAKALADAGLEGDADVSEAGQAIGQQVFTECVDLQSLINSTIDEMASEDEALDVGCLKSALSDVSTTDEFTDTLLGAAFGCIDSDG
jgi:hypothetical protein